MTGTRSKKMQKDLSYKAAMKVLKEGYRVKRKHWTGFWVMEETCLNPDADSHVWQEWFSAIVEYGRNGQGYDGKPAFPIHQDTKAHDWEVVEKRGR
jgi:hypothetical protein